MERVAVWIGITLQLWNYSSLELEQQNDPQYPMLLSAEKLPSSTSQGNVDPIEELRSEKVYMELKALKWSDVIKIRVRDTVLLTFIGIIVFLACASFNYSLMIV